MVDVAAGTPAAIWVLERGLLLVGRGEEAVGRGAPRVAPGSWTGTWRGLRSCGVCLLERCAGQLVLLDTLWQRRGLVGRKKPIL